MAATAADQHSGAGQRTKAMGETLRQQWVLNRLIDRGAADQYARES